jgi:acetyltransferase-like isoleucine patch superfamily enzyme
MSGCVHRWCTGLATLLLPSFMARLVLRAFGHVIASDVRIGISLVLVDRLALEGGVRIGHFNGIRARRLVMRRGAYVGRSNLVHGPMSIDLGPRAAIGNRNKLLRGPRGVTYGPALVRLGELAKITADHRLDCTCSILFGAFSTLAGTGSQLWTHGYVHDESDEGRYRVDGRIVIGKNVYIGSGTIITAGVRIADASIIGAGSTVARSLSEPGIYVSAGLRRLDRPAAPETRADLEAVSRPELCERVFRRRSST